MSKAEKIKLSLGEIPKLRGRNSIDYDKIISAIEQAPNGKAVHFDWKEAGFNSWKTVEATVRVRAHRKKMLVGIAERGGILMMWKRNLP